MYELFYGLRAEPFRLSPDHRFCYEHSAYSKARAYMAYALKRAEGFVMITGRPGTGKTTLIGELVEDLAHEGVTAANLVCTQLEADDLLKTVAYSFGVGSSGVDKAELLQRITVLLNRWHREKRRALLVVDEAQDLSVSAMEELRLLTNIQVGGQPLLQIFLLGQPELRDLILSPPLEQVHQRIVAASHLEGLAADETEAYVVHRLHTVGWNGDPAIDRRIFPLIHKFSEGVPRRINLICSRLFLLGSVEERHEISVGDVRVVIAELQAESLAAGSAFSDEEFVVDGEPDWVAVPGNDDGADTDAAAVPLRAVSNESFAPAAPADEPPARVETLAPVTPLKQPEPEPEPVADAPAELDEASAVEPAGEESTDAATPQFVLAPDEAELAAAPVDEDPSPGELPQRVAASVPRSATAQPRRSLGRPLLVLGIVLTLGVALLFFLELYVSRDGGWEAVPAGEVIPMPPAAEPEEPIEELGILPSEQWELDGTLIDWERDAAQRDAPAIEESTTVESAPSADSADTAARTSASAADVEVVAAPDAVLMETGAAPTVASTVASAAASTVPTAAETTNTETQTTDAAEARPVPEQSLADSEQLLALLNEDAAAATYSVTFDFDSIALSIEARNILAQALDKMAAEPGLTAQVTGFADYQGNELYNLQLSLERARAVRDYLIEAGVPQERLLVSGRGAQPPEGEVGAGQRRQLRAVQISLLGGAN